MPTLSSTYEFFERAQLRGSDQNRELLINGEEVKKKLQPCTERNYARALARWEQYKLRNPGATPNDIKASKDFMWIIAFGIEGKYDDVKACVSSVVQAYKDFTAGWQWAGYETISSKVTRTTSNFIKGDIQRELKLVWRKRIRAYGTMIHFLYLGTQLWQNDWHRYRKPGFRIDVWAEIQLNVFTSARVGEYLESTCRAGSGRGLHYRDTIFTIFRNEYGKAEFAMQVVKDAKGMTFTPEKRPEHSLHEGLEPRPFFCNPILIHLAIFIARKAFRDYKTMDELLDIEAPEGEEMFHIQWEQHMLDLPIYQRDSGEIASAQVFSTRLRDLGSRAGYIRPPTIHDFRAEGLHLIDRLYSPAQRQKHAGHRGENTYRDFYAPQNPGTDGQGSYFGDTPRSIVNDRFRTITLSRNPELWQSLPAEKQSELENSDEFMAIEEELESLIQEFTDTSAARDRRKELRAQKRKLVCDELRKIQKLQPLKLSSEANEGNSMASHHTRFSRVSNLIPVRRRLASALPEAVYLREKRGRAILADVIKLYQQDTEVAFRPGLEPEKCQCEAERNRKIDKMPAAQRWKHIYGCYKKHLCAHYGFAELCFLCSEWIIGENGWEGHCQDHLNTPAAVPVQCNPLTYGGCLAQPGYCVWCLGNATIPAASRMYQFLERAEWRDHINQHNENIEGDKTFICSHPRQCDDSFQTARELRFHLQDVHCVEITKRWKRSNLDSEGDTKPRKKIKSSGHANRYTPYVHQGYKFVNEGAKLWRPKTSRQETASSISSTDATPDRHSELDQSVPDTLSLSACSDESIDPILLAESNVSSVKPSIDNTAELADITGLNLGMTHSMEAYECNDGSNGASISDQDLGHSPLALMQTTQDEATDSELEEDEFIVERLLGKRVRQVGKRKLIQYLVKWKGYTEAENTWEDVKNFHKDLIQEYESQTSPST